MEINIEISGPAGSGKTALLNVIANHLGLIGLRVEVDSEAQSMLDGNPVIDIVEQVKRTSAMVAAGTVIVIKDSQEKRNGN